MIEQLTQYLPYIVIGVILLIFPRIAGREMKRAVTLAGKSQNTKKLFESMGIKNVKLEDFNHLTNEGVTRLIALRVAEKRADEALKTGGDNELMGMMNTINQLQQSGLGMANQQAGGLTSMFGINPNPQPQPEVKIPDVDLEKAGFTTSKKDTKK